MKIFDIENIRNILDYGVLYDLFQMTYTYNKSDIEYTYIVEREFESRIDLICNKIYSNVDKIDFILNYNKIDNPLNIKEGDIIKYIDIFKIDNSKVFNNLSNNITYTISNNNSIIDTNRKEYIDRISSPTYNKTSQKPVYSENGKIIIR